jgi:pimeloyl-ACP methyl ester carboxylesterase
LVLAALGGTLFAGGLDAVAADSCRGVRASCTHVTVPLDRAGAVPGTVRLHVERHRARKAVRPPLFLIAGGPGQSATSAFARLDGSDVIGTEARSRDVIVMDLRGTGRSDLLRCSALERTPFRSQQAAGAACAAELGARRAHYTAVDSADDIEAVRRALGVPAIALYGTSYGTQVAMTYARRYPAYVERMVLDSVVEPGGSDPLYASGMRAAPGVVRRICGGGVCRSFTRDAAADLARLAARLERRPMRGRVVSAGGHPRSARIDAFGLFSVLLAGDVNPAFHGLAPGAVKSALRGDAAPLLRAHRDAILSESGLGSPRDFSIAAYAAAQCQESPFPWSAAASPDQRREQVTAFVAAQPPGAFGPFGATAPLGSDDLDLCSAWPEAGASRPSLGPLPDVPTLLLAGGMDLRTPVENARAVAAALPRAQLMVVRDSGHSVAGMDFTGCVDRSLRRFLAGGQAGRCSGMRLTGGAMPPPPRSFRRLAAHPGLRGRPGRTATAVGWTVLDGFMSLGTRMWSSAFFELLGDPDASVRWGGLRGGSYAFSARRGGTFSLRRASIVHGVRVSGVVRLGDEERPVTGRLRVGGRAATEGTLRLGRNMRLIGRLGGREVSVPLLGRRSFRSFAVATATSSRQARLAQRLPRLR